LKWYETLILIVAVGIIAYLIWQYLQKREEPQYPFTLPPSPVIIGFPSEETFQEAVQPQITIPTATPTPTTSRLSPTTEPFAGVIPVSEIAFPKESALSKGLPTQFTPPASSPSMQVETQPRPLPATTEKYRPITPAIPRMGR
jgi:hypothetical protein